MSVKFDELSINQHQKIAIATLDAPKSLNALNIDMIEMLLEKLNQWRHNDEIVCVFMDSSSERAFCAGGDIKNLYYGVKDSNFEALELYFEQEYLLDYTLYTYEKPIIAWGQGLIMGGGLGIFSGCSHRVICQDVKMAMPEMKIGFFPDVGASFFLRNLFANAGLFVGLTSEIIEQSDAILHSLADYAMDKDNKSLILDELSNLKLGSNDSENHALIHQLLQNHNQINTMNFSNSEYIKNADFLLNFSKSLSAQHAIELLRTKIENDDKENTWLADAYSRLSSMSPFSCAVFYEQLKRSQHLSLAEIFNFERDIAYHMFRFPDLAEGVRALLIDKDNQPDWHFKSLSSVTQTELEKIFKPLHEKRPYLI